ncbi:hypothetical protein CTL2C_517 [Chlamydia trachomatis L2c]|nr:hypothetical protein CTL2C_517 [Chlamydia trachomatis L2c]AGO32787.1 hypothetical protein CTLINITIAL_04940 [Chlamydia trachomatis L2/434/Bu(i)]AGO32829.1 hypothetical protein CTLFINAL_04940 [Chlamydia trachomatis L2/434/Bu(f)]AKC30671.1 hypothetical protein L2bCS78408_03875 [Chlamydia trachomatis]AKC31581.1 hypothetical protein L2bCS1908_03875 [Chlamydia trachomatis]
MDSLLQVKNLSAYKFLSILKKKLEGLSEKTLILSISVSAHTQTKSLQKVSAKAYPLIVRNH